MHTVDAMREGDGDSDSDGGRNWEAPEPNEGQNSTEQPPAKRRVLESPATKLSSCRTCARHIDRHLPLAEGGMLSLAGGEVSKGAF